MAINLVNPLSMQLHVHQQMLYQQHQMALHHHYQQDELSNAWSAMLNNSHGPKLPDDVKVELENKRLWEQFHAHTTEMIITKSGRRMFPSVQLKVTGLERRTKYCVLMELAQASPRRHKYVGGGVGGGDDGNASRTGGQQHQQQQPRGWTSAGPSEPQPALKRRLYVHPDSPATGAQWMQQPLSFSKLKLTNNVIENHSNILLTSMHKYNPRIWIVRCDELDKLQLNLYDNPSKSFVFKETEFIAVTAYQNEAITKLKIDNNPFAKGFRETGQSTCKRKRRLQHDDPSNSSEGEEEGNVSSSDSDSTAPTIKRARLSETDAESSCSVSSSERDVVTPAEQQQQQHQQQHQQPTARRDNNNAQPRLHRPWCDDDDSKQEQVKTLPVTLSQQRPQQQHYVQQHNFLGIHPTAQYHLMALELARMHQLQHRYAYAAQHLDFRR